MSTKHESLQPEPVLAGPQRTGAPILTAVAVVLAAATSAGLGVGLWGDEGEATGTGGGGRVFVMNNSDVPGAVKLVDEDLPGIHLIERMQLSLADKQRLKEALSDRRVRLGRLVVWDNVAVDGDAIILSSTGFAQTLPITHERQILYLPVVTGSSAQITALRDGEGGVTLGVQTMIGPVFLPRLAVGDTVEIPVL